MFMAAETLYRVMYYGLVGEGTICSTVCARKSVASSLPFRTLPGFSKPGYVARFELRNALTLFSRKRNYFNATRSQDELRAGASSVGGRHLETS